MFSSVQFIRSVAFDSLQPHGLQHTRPPCPSWTPGDYPNSCPLSRWCHPTTSSGHLCCPLFLLPSIFPSIRIFSRSWIMIRVMDPDPLQVNSSNWVAKVLEFEHQSFQWIFRTDFFRFDWLDLIAVQGTLKSLHQQHSSKALTLQHSTFFIIQLSHAYMTTGKTIALTRWTYLAK